MLGAFPYVVSPDSQDPFYRPHAVRRRDSLPLQLTAATFEASQSASPRTGWSSKSTMPCIVDPQRTPL